MEDIDVDLEKSGRGHSRGYGARLCCRCPGQYGLVEGLIVPFTFLMVYPMMVTLKIREVFSGGNMRAQVVTPASQLCRGSLSHLWCWLALFSRSTLYDARLLLAGLVPTSGMTISWTGFAKGNMAAAVKMTVIA